MSKLAENLLIPSAVNQLTAEFASDFREEKDINLGVGYVNDKTIPNKAIKQAFKYIVKHPGKYRNALNYGGAQGSPNLLKSIEQYYLKNKIGNISPEILHSRKLLIGANGATSLLDSISDILKPGIVITADPFYYIFTETLENKGFKIETTCEDEFGIIPEEIEKAIERNTPEDISFFYIVTVNNPSTVILSNDRRKRIVEIATELSTKLKRKVPVIFDKAYEDIIHDPNIEKPVSGLNYDTKKIAFELGTLSKIIAPALRVGYMFCPDDKICMLLTQKTSDIGFSASLINQEIASWLLDNYIDKQKKIVNAGYQKKATFIEQLIQEYIGPYLKKYSGGKAAFYYYITLNNIETGKQSRFYKFLSRTTGDKSIDGTPVKKERLVYIPGEICSKEPDAGFQLRISYGFEENSTFEKAFLLIRQACEYAVSDQ